MNEIFHGYYISQNRRKNAKVAKNHSIEISSFNLFIYLFILVHKTKVSMVYVALTLIENEVKHFFVNKIARPYACCIKTYDCCLDFMLKDRLRQVCKELFRKIPLV